MLTRVLSAGLLAGLFAGLAIAILQNFTTTPLILAAEVYENAPPAKAAAIGDLVIRTSGNSDAPLILAHGDGHGAAGGHGAGGHGDGGAEEWVPADGLERVAFTSAATISASIAFAFLLLGGMLIAGDQVTERHAMAWAAAGFVATGLAPAIGLAPELPGMVAADLLARQSWWLLTAAMTALSLWLFLRTNDVRMRGLAILVLLAPHVLGAPQHSGDAASNVPADLAARFAAMSLAVHAALWVATGFAVGTIWPVLAKSAQPQAAGQS
ncbi:MAG: CbtA family protein [Hyphomicrobium sp.]|jgi:cobalt transporter subunit CbtA